MGCAAIVKMPWSSLSYPSAGMGTLKALLGQEGIATDNLYLDFYFARLVGYQRYETMSDISTLIGLREWFFSQHLFDGYASNAADSVYSAIEMHYRRKGLPVPPDLDVASLCNIRELVPEFIEECLDKVSWEKYAVVGFTSVYCRHTASLLLSRKLKERWPETKIVFGGANVWGGMGRETLRSFEWVDYVIEGEGELAFPQLVNNILAKQPAAKVDGVSFRHANNLYFSEKPAEHVQLDNLPVPDYTDYYQALDAAGLTGIIPVAVEFEASRGCWWGQKVQCAFCGVNGHSLEFRSKSPTRVIAEIKQLDDQLNKLGKGFLLATDNIVNMDFFATVFPKLIAEGRKYDLFYEVKASLRKEDLIMLKKVGVHLLQVGIESMDTELLRIMNKGVTALENIQFLKWCRELDIPVYWNFLYGAPGETIAAYNRMKNLIPVISHLPPPGAFVRIVLQRYSSYFHRPKEYSICAIEPQRPYSLVYPPEKVDVQEMALFFDYKGGNFAGQCEEYVEPVRAAVGKWQQEYQESGASLYYQLNEEDGVVALFDSRAAAAASGMILHGLPAAIYVFCDAIQSLREVCRYVQRQSGTQQVREQEVKAVLDRFVKAGLMYEANGRYLSLAVRGH